MNAKQMAEKAQRGFEIASQDQAPAIEEDQWQTLEVLRQSDSKGGTAHALGVSKFTLAKKAVRVFEKLGV